MENNILKKIQNEQLNKNWKIGTDISVYLIKQLNYWLTSVTANKIKKIDDSKIIYTLKNTLNNKYFCAFLVDRNFIVYNHGNREDEYNNVYSKATISQFLRILQIFNVIKLVQYEENKNYVFTDDFWNFIFAKRDVDKLNLFLISNTRKLLEEYYNNLKHYIDDGTYDETKIDSFQIAYNIFLELLSVLSSDLYKKAKRFGMIEKNHEYYCNKYIKEIMKDEHFTSEINKIFNNLKELYKSIWQIETDEEIKKILYDDSAYNNINYKYYSDSNSNWQSKIYSLESWINDIKINIPIFQREYTWDIEMITNLLSTLILDFQKRRSSYLNNIILLNNGWAKNNYSDIIDGQQRLITILLILNAVAKILRYKNKTIPKLMYELFYDKENHNYLTNLFSNYKETESYKLLWTLLNSQMGNQIDEDIKLESKQSIKSLKVYYCSENICAYIWKKVKKENFDIELFAEYLLTRVFVTITELHDIDGSKIFQNLNQNVKALNGLDLFRNYLYEKANQYEKASCKDIIETYNKDFCSNFENKPSKNGNIKLDTKMLEHFVKTIWYRKFNNTIEIDSSNQHILVFSCLKNWFDDTMNTFKNKPSLVLEELIKLFNKYNYLLNVVIAENSNYKEPKTEYAPLSQMLFAATFGCKNSTVIPLIWELFDKFNAFDYDSCSKLNDQAEELSKWLFEIERFMIFWKFCDFSGESLTESIWTITEKIHEGTKLYNNLYDTINLRKDLFEKISGFRNQNYNSLNNKLHEVLLQKYANINNIPNKNKNVDNQNKKLLLLRYSYYIEAKTMLVNSRNYQLNYLHGSKSIKVAEYDHVYETKINDENNEMEYNIYTNMIGNGQLLSKTQNTSKNSKSKKQYNDTIYKSEISFETEDERNQKIKSKEYQQLILDESNKIIDTLVEMYKLD